MPTITINKKAKHDYQILEKFEAGIVLDGAEVKSVKTGHISLKNSYITIDKNQELWLIDCHIAHYKPASTGQKNYQPTKNRKLLLKKPEIAHLIGKSKQKGLTIIPISVYTKGSLIKLEIGVVKAKKKYDKREELKKRAVNKEIRQKMKN